MSYYVKLCAASTLITWTLLLAMDILVHSAMVSSFVGSASYTTWLWWRKD